MNDYYCSDKVRYFVEDTSSSKEGSSKESPYPKFRVEYEVNGEPNVSVVSAKSVDLAKRMVYISESSKGNINVKILKVVTL